jgi:glycolate oxidase subunit GlcD
MPIPEKLISRLVAELGERYVLSDPTELLVYEADGLPHHRHRPDVVVLPDTTEQVQAIMRACDEFDVPVVPRGSGTGLSGGAVAVQGGVIIGVTRMNRVLEIDYENRIAVVEPGVLNLALTNLTTPNGWYFAPDPSSQAACTLGGNVAENAGGPHCLKYGVTLNHVLGLEVVLPNGDLVEIGGEADTPGYDLLGLFIGSEGTLGIATKLTLRLERTPQGVRTMLVDYESIYAACESVSEIIADGIVPAAMELIDKRTIATVEDSVLAAGYPRDADAVLVIELDGLEPSLDNQAARVTEICKRSGARTVRMALDDAERAKLWAGRKAAFGAIGRLAPDLFVQDAVVPRTKLADMLSTIHEICDREGVQVSNVFHAGDGNLHPNVPFDSRDKDQVERVERVMKEVIHACVEVGGTISGEHGVGKDKRKYMDLIFTPETLEVMAGIRDVWNPRGLLNPGKILPDRFAKAVPPRTAGTQRRAVPQRSDPVVSELVAS